MTNPLLSHSKQYNSLLLRAFPSLTKINGEYLSNEERQKYKSSPSISKNSIIQRSSQSASYQRLYSLIQSLQAYRSFNTKQLFQKILITFAGTTALMHLQKSILPFTLVERLLKTNLETPLITTKDAGSKFRVFNDKLFYRNLASVAAQRSSCASITNYIVMKC